ncbi:transmembrane protein, putative (macronuclear) [Tetrahymena thermophila SB210]|uniref:Transmembrane protein, putative n=1 Tax=Tetrahymena thermophila (strain SB210) TaxID=312017 RepID=Q22RP7_TETTS|nr:transmembrane protein, putative [Tetrahymena thermophila SB210]EAR88075.1 transmembrane protein, putative [Tetrahymena thermophila SB210]|eukprot:XP_001008320.1 transmembrane protein, putative [Tetrahymena thermophila SB210]
MQYEQLNQINPQLGGNNDSAWGKDLIIVIFYGIFGGLFYAFSTNPERYSKCDDSQFIDWTKLTMIVCLSYTAVSLIKLPLYICKLTQKCPTLWSSLEAVGGIFVIICGIGLTVKDNKSCGELHTLAMVFYILVYISLGILGLVICCSCICCAGMVASASMQKTDDLEGKPMNNDTAPQYDGQL